MRHLTIVAFAAAILYGSTYQQFRFFNVDDPGGATDAVHYLEQARGVVQVDPEIRHYRWLTPSAARALQPLTLRMVDDELLSLRLAFYLVNFTFSLLACLALFRALELLGFSAVWSLLGVAAFASSRITVLATATPLVDAFYFCAIAIVVWLTLEARVVALAVALPLLVLGKETIIPFLFLPLLTDLRKRPIIWLSLAVALLAFTAKGQLIADYYAGDDASYLATVLEHARDVGSTALSALSLTGLHDVQNGFSLFLPLSGIGAWLNRRHHYHAVPWFIAATVPIALALALLSGNLGRMFFAAYPAVITYALIAIKHFMGGTAGGEQQA